MKKCAVTIFILASLMLVSCGEVFSQPTSTPAPAVTDPFTTMVSIVSVLVIVILFQSFLIMKLVRFVAELNYKLIHGVEMPSKETIPAVEVVHVVKEKAFSRLWKSLTRSVPKGREKDVMLDHNYDGIRELDNRMPPWLQLIFYSTIVAAVSYLMIFHVLHTGKLQGEEYADELKQASIKKEAVLKSAAASVDEATVKQLTDANSLNIGKALFISKCSPCHGMNGQGNVGPNLTDNYWLHGGAVNDIFKTVKYGVPGKGMISWQAVLQPQEMQEVVSFIMSLNGSNPAEAKAPQGDLYSPVLIPATDTSVITTPLAKSKI